MCYVLWACQPSRIKGDQISGVHRYMFPQQLSSSEGTSTIKVLALSSITRKVRHSAPRRPSTTPATSISARACATCPRYAKSAFRPTVAFWKRRASPTTACSPNKPFQQLNLPRTVQEQRASALRFADPMVQAIWNALLIFDRLPTGFCNRDLRNNLAALLGRPVEHFTQGRMSYQLRRLRLHGLIERIPKTHRYRLTSFGLRVALFCTRIRSLPHGGRAGGIAKCGNRAGGRGAGARQWRDALLHGSSLA